jgi:selenocysteine lyase/cysteine desulfurase
LTTVDILACGEHKWLNSPFGAGLLYIRKGRLPELKKLTAGYLSLETPEGGWETCFQTPSISPLRDYTLVDEARRYEVGGTANYPGAVGLAAFPPPWWGRMKERRNQMWETRTVPIFSFFIFSR